MLTTRPEDLLNRASRAFLGTADRDGPVVVPTACWSDGDGLWMSVTVADVPAAAGVRTIECVAYVPPVEHGEAGMVVHGAARVHSLAHPLGATLHAATISTAMAALAARDPAALVGSVRHAARAPLRWSPRTRVVLRLVVDLRAAVDPPDVGPGMAPPLPTAVPPEVRRALAGERQVVVVTAEDGGLEATPAVWAADYSLRTPPTRSLPAGLRAAVAVNAAEVRRSGQTAGLVLHGRLDAGGRLEPDRMVAWLGSQTTAAPVTRPGGGIVLPD